MRTVTPQPWVPVTRQEICTAVITVVVTFVVVCALALVALESLLAGSGALRVLRVALASLGAGCLASGLSCFIMALPFNRRLRESSRRDAWLLRRLSRVVLEGKHRELRPGEQVEAVAYAVAMTVLLPFRFGYFALVFAGLLLEEVQLTLSAELTPSSSILAIVLVLLGLSTVLTQYRQLQRARSYAHQNVMLLAAG